MTKHTGFKCLSAPMRHLALAGTVAAAGLGIAAPALAESVLKVVPHADLRNIDPIWTTAYITRNHGYLVWDTLFAMDENLEVQPQMAEGYEVSEDGLTYTITLRDGLMFHDGAPVKAEDAVASIKRWGQRDGMGQKLMRVTESIEAVDDKTLTLTLSEPYGLVLQSLAKSRPTCRSSCPSGWQIPIQTSRSKRSLARARSSLWPMNGSRAIR